MKNDILAALNTLSDADLLARVKSLTLRERDATAQLVAHLAVLDTRRDAFLGEGYPSLYVYCRDALGLSGGEAYNRIEVARAARQFPIILEMLAAGEIYLWSVRLLAPHLTPDNHAEVLGWARGKKSKLPIQEFVAKLAPRPDVPPSIRRIPAPPPEPTPVSVASPQTEEPIPIAAEAFHPPLAPTPPLAATPPAPRAAVTPLSPDRYKFQLTISGDTLEKLRLAKDMLSHAVPAGDDAAVLDRALTGCTYVGHSGHRCEERRFIQFHHLDARARGGKATADRITLRCRAHNDYEGRLLFGKRRRTDGAGVVREDRAVYGSRLHGASNLLWNESVTARSAKEDVESAHGRGRRFTSSAMSTNTGPDTFESKTAR
jgi:hypothetical protein